MNVDLLKAFFGKRHRPYLVIALGLFGLALLVELTVKPLQAEYFPVRFVRVQGTFKFIEKSKLEEKIGPQIESGYWDLDLKLIRLKAERIPWIRHVRIQRVWPDTLVLWVDEHVPFARLGENRLISIQSVSYLPGDTRAFADLPLIVGPNEQSAKLFEAFQQMQSSIANLGMVLEKLQVTDRKSWSVQTSGGLTIELGREAPLKVFQRFIATLSLMGKQQIRSMVRVDLRYQNGYAVEWKPGTEPEWSSFVKRNDRKQGDPIQSI